MTVPAAVTYVWAKRVLTHNPQEEKADEEAALVAAES